MNDQLRLLLALARQLTLSGPDREAYERLVLDHTPHGTPIRDRPATGYTVDGVPVSNPTPAADMAHAVGPEPSDDDIDVMKEYLREYCADGVTEYMDGLAAGAYRIAAERRPSPPSPIDWERAMWVLRSAYWGGLKEIEPVSEWDSGDKEDWHRVAEAAQGLFGGANAAPAIPEAVRGRAREIARELPSDDALREFVPEGVDFPHSERSAVFVAAALVRELAGAP